MAMWQQTGVALALVAGMTQVVVQAAAPQPLPVKFSSSLKLNAPNEGGSLTLKSEPVKLEVGRLYKLTARVKTAGVKVDPEARYPTALGACLSMESFPFTNASAGTSASQTQELAVTFFASKATDRVQLHLGRNGKAWGRAEFSEVRLAPADITEHIPMETVRWSQRAYRYEDRGWTFVHIEGEPYTRGCQFGELMAEDITRFLDKLAVSMDGKNPEHAWDQARGQTDALFLRKYDPEFLEEMKGIADGAAAKGATFKGRKIDVLDIVTANSGIDLDYVQSALRVTPNALTGRTFTRMDEQAAGAPERDKCSSFVATKSATTDGRPVMIQMFMWGAYTGLEWNVIVDVVPTKGQRLVYQTFPGGISSGADWYMNGAGMVIGETTVGQTPWDPEGTPQANRIRKAAQYATSIEGFASIFKAKNNGLYTNEWILADMKTNEGADYLIGTKVDKLWRTGHGNAPADTPAGHKDFIWANNNNRDLEIRKEAAQNGESWPADLAFNTWDRDIAFQQFYAQFGKGRMDVHAGIGAMASSPINRPHACDGKITTGEMADQLMFHAHHGKTTLREKMPGGRYIDATQPNAIPQLTYGYATFSPIHVTRELQATKAKFQAPKAPVTPRLDLGDVKPAFDKAKLWKQTVFPATETDFWLSSGDAAYSALLRRAPEAPDKAFTTLRDAFADLTQRYLVLARREGSEAPGKTTVRYDRYGAYVLPRTKGVFLLHQLRLLLGNDRFAKGMGAVHQAFALKPMTRAQFEHTFSGAVNQDIAPLVAQWIDRADLPDPKVTAEVKGQEVVLTVRQGEKPWRFATTVEVRTDKGAKLHRIEVGGTWGEHKLPFEGKATRVIFNAGQDIPTEQPMAATQASLSDDFSKLLVVWGSGSSVEAGRTLALTFRDAMADASTEVLAPVKADGEVTSEELSERDLILMGGAENALLARLVAEKKVPLELGKGWFKFQGTTYGRGDEGMFLALPNPWNPKRFLHLYVANSRLQLWQMTKAYPRGLSGWATWRGTAINGRGSHVQPAFDLKVN